MTQPENVLRLTDFKVNRDGVRILEIPSFSLRENEFISLIGPNGAGKSTLLLAILGLIKPESGSLWYRGSELKSEAARLAFRRKTAMVLQEPLLFDGSVYDNVASGLKIRGIAGGELRNRVTTQLERFKLVDLADRSARKLSGGESRRVSLARAFAVDPEVIFFDEPFANLDAPTRQSLTDDLDRVLHERQIAAILVTHDQSDALRMSSRVVVLNNGSVVQDGTPLAVMHAPVNDFVANFVGMETILEGTVLSNVDQQMAVLVEGQEMDVIGGQVPGSTVYCCIRPESVTVNRGKPAQISSARNVFPGRIVEIASLGPFLRLRLDCGFSVTSYVTRDSFLELELSQGCEVYASFKATSVHLIAKRGE